MRDPFLEFLTGSRELLRQGLASNPGYIPKAWRHWPPRSNTMARQPIDPAGGAHQRGDAEGIGRGASPQCGRR